MNSFLIAFAVALSAPAPRSVNHIPTVTVVGQPTVTLPTTVIVGTVPSTTTVRKGDLYNCSPWKDLASGSGQFKVCSVR